MVAPRWAQVLLVLLAGVLAMFLLYYFASSLNSSQRNKKVSESLLGYYSSRGGEYSYVDDDFFKMKNITARTLDNKTVVLDIAILSRKPKDLYLKRSALLLVVQGTISRTSTVTYKRGVNLANIKMIIDESVFELTGMNSETYFENLYYY